MLDWLKGLDPLWQALCGGLFTWFVTALGAAAVFLKRDMPRAALDALLGFAAGVMIAASVWSLLIPGMEMAEAQGTAPWIPAATGFLLGGVFLRLADRWLPHFHPQTERQEGPDSSWRRATLLIAAITLHNIPEGLAVGVAFAAAAHDFGAATGATFGAAVALAVGIGLQNFPEGIAVAMPLRREGVGQFKSFMYGQLSAVVEPVAAVLGAALVMAVRPLLPYALAFAAGAMIFVVIEELIPEAQQDHHHDLATGGAMVGFVVMMVMDVALG